MLKAGLLVVAVLVAASVTPVTSRGAASKGCSAAVHRNTARLTIKALKIINRPIRTTKCALAYGPIWDPGRMARPGDGLSMVIDGHDVTPVPGYGKHGPFNHLDIIKPGYWAKIKWHGVWRRYRFTTRPFARRQCKSKRVNDSAAHLRGGTCVENDAPIRQYGHDVVYFRCCWPRYTYREYLYARAVLVSPKT
jgi:hypothetical protein